MGLSTAAPDRLPEKLKRCKNKVFVISAISNTWDYHVVLNFYRIRT